jgi:hypothetical protein
VATGYERLSFGMDAARITRRKAEKRKIGEFPKSVARLSGRCDCVKFPPTAIMGVVSLRRLTAPNGSIFFDGPSIVTFRAAW